MPAPVYIRCTLDVDEAARALADLERKHIPFATALALTRTAQAVQTEQREVALPQRFILRNSWVQKGIRITAATKRDLTATVYTKDDFMGRHETGGTKTARSHPEFAIPADVRESVKDIIPKSRQPGRILMSNSDRVFEGRLKGGQRAIFERRTDKAYPLRVLYLFRKTAPITPRLGMEESTQIIVSHEFRQIWERSFREAMATAR